jgi:hypothetical protein
MICQQCRIEFDKPNRRGPSPKFCSGRCRAAAYHARHQPDRAVIAQALRFTAEARLVDLSLAFDIKLSEAEALRDRCQELIN